MVLRQDSALSWHCALVLQKIQNRGKEVENMKRKLLDKELLKENALNNAKLRHAVGMPAQAAPAEKIQKWTEVAK